MNKDELVNELLSYFMNENKNVSISKLPTDYMQKRNALRGFMNIREPKPLPPEILALQDCLLREELESHEIISPLEVPTVAEMFNKTKSRFADKLILWQGDITTLAADAIVNAANSKLLGCFVPMHRCIDNAIHSAAGVQLRFECNAIMQMQAHDEFTGQAKVTSAYNLPSKYVIHTVGPIINSEPSAEDSRQLAACYTSCLNTANGYTDIRSIAFCCISTGEYRFPNRMASEIAVETVCRWLDQHPDRFDRIIFNVFTDKDYQEYSRLFE